MTTEPIRDKKQLQALSDYFLYNRQIRNYVLFTVALHTALRISDILRLRWDDVYDFVEKRPRIQAFITEKKTGKAKIITLNKRVASALAMYASKAVQGAALIANPKTGKAISRVQAYRIFRDAAEIIGMESRVSCHSLRKTFGYLVRKAGVSPELIMEIYRHSSYNITRRYIGITQDEMDQVYLTMEMLL